MARRSRREYPDDDGRTIVPMNVDGMPWYTRGVDDPAAKDPSSAGGKAPKPPMSREERRGYMWAAVKAALLIGSVFAVAFFLFLLFCYWIWFK